MRGCSGSAGPDGGGLGGRKGGAVVSTQGFLAARIAGVVDQRARRGQVGVPRAPVGGQQVDSDPKMDGGGKWTVGTHGQWQQVGARHVN